MVRPPSGLSGWCLEQLGAEVDEVLWIKGHLSWVAGVQLGDGREVVVKVRPWIDSLPSCHAVHRHVWRAEFPCPEPLTGPTNMSGVAISAEAHLPGGQPGAGDDPTLAERTARALARLVAAAPEPLSIPSLYPPPPWAGWDDADALPWPAPDEGSELNNHPSTAPLRALAEALNERLRHDQLAGRVGHVDFYQGNLRWQGNDLLAADDWDSLAVLPEAAIVGCAAASFRRPFPACIRTAGPAPRSMTARTSSSTTSKQHVASSHPLSLRSPGLLAFGNVSSMPPRLSLRADPPTPPTNSGTRRPEAASQESRRLPREGERRGMQSRGERPSRRTLPPVTGSRSRINHAEVVALRVAHPRVSFVGRDDLAAQRNKFLDFRLSPSARDVHMHRLLRHSCGLRLLKADLEVGSVENHPGIGLRSTSNGREPLNLGVVVRPDLEVI